MKGGEGVGIEKDGKRTVKLPDFTHLLTELRGEDFLFDYL